MTAAFSFSRPPHEEKKQDTRDCRLAFHVSTSARQDRCVRSVFMMCSDRPADRQTHPGAEEQNKQVGRFIDNTHTHTQMDRQCPEEQIDKMD